MLRAALETQILPSLAVRSASAQDLAERLKVDSVGLARLLECCRDLGLVERRGAVWRVPPAIARWVDRRSTDFIGDHLVTTASQTQTWDDLVDTLRGEQRADRGIGALPRRPAYAEFLTQGLMGRVSAARAVVDHLTTHDDRAALVVFGGAGEFVRALRTTRRSMNVDVVDHPELLSRTIEMLVDLDGIEYLSLGFGSSDRRYDVILFPHVVRGVSDAQFQGFLRKSRKLLSESGRVIVADVFRDSSLGEFVPWLDLSLYVNTRHGRIRALADVNGVARGAGFDPDLVIHAPGVTGISYRKVAEC